MKKDFEPIHKALSAPTLCLHLEELLKITSQYIDGTFNNTFKERWKTIRENYDLLLHYVEKGTEDPQRDRIYMQQLRDAYALMLDIAHFEQVNTNRSYSLAHSRSAGFDGTLYKVKKQLEDYVTSLPLLELEQGEERKMHKAMLNKEHQEYVNKLFDYTLSSFSWTVPDADFYVNMILSPTIDRRDVLQLVSAFTLSVADVFDIQKVRILYRLAMESTDEYVRQRALVGFVLTADSRYIAIYPELREMATSLVGKGSPIRLEDLVDMQIQLFYCITVYEDAETLNKDIIPELVQSSNLRMDADGSFTENGDNPMDDILSGGKDAEERIAKMEDGFHKMESMQKDGSDIYFGGFSQMKRYTFFYTLSNWFCPFYAEHPDLQHLLSSYGKEGVPPMLTRESPFCDSDRYSFFIGLASIFSRLPEAVREMFAYGQGVFPAGGNPETFTSPAFIRRMYMQDLNRFFALYADRADFSNLFESKENPYKCLFFSNNLFVQLLDEAQIFRLCEFFLKKRRYQDLLFLLQCADFNVTHDQMWRVCYYRGIAFLRLDFVSKGYDYLSRALVAFQRIGGDEAIQVKILRLLARAAVASCDYDNACELYEKLSKLRPKDLKVKMNLILVLIQYRKTDEALKLAYELSFADEKSVDVKRTYAWALLNAGKQDAARREYEWLIASKHVNMEDLQNASYCFWANRETEKAIDSMYRFFILWRDTQDYDDYSGSEAKRLAIKLYQDTALLHKLSISRTQCALLVDLVMRKMDEEDD